MKNFKPIFYQDYTAFSIYFAIKQEIKKEP